MLDSTVDRSTGRWRDILTRIGVPAESLSNKMGPCPMCGGKTRFRFDDKSGSGSWFCNHCGAGYGIHLAMKYTGKDFKSTVEEIDRMDGLQKTEIPPEIDPRIRLRKIAESCMRDDGTIAEYMRNRGITIPVPESLKLYAEMPYFEDGKQVNKYHAMCAIFSDQNGAAASYHVTYLFGGSKAPVSSARKFMKPAIETKGGAIRLTKTIPETLAVAEGIETALSVTQLYGYPCWATYCAGMLEAFVVPDGVKRLIICADNDKSYTGQKAAYLLANKTAIKHHDMQIDVTMPGVAETDFNDVLRLA